MKENEKVSIIMPVYNSENYLRQNIDSILKQTYSELEIILVNDGSTDRSESIIQEMQQEDDRIIYQYQENQGAPIARNKGLDIATGDYIYLIDSDDYLPKDSIENMILASHKYNSDLIIGQFDMVNDVDDYLRSTTFAEQLGIEFGKKHEKELIALVLPFPGNKLYRADVIKNNGVRFADVKLAQDVNFFLKALLFTDKPIVIKDTVYYYRMREGSISHTYNSKILEVIRSIDDVEKFYRKHDAYDEQLFSNVRFLHYYFQFSKTPKIANRAEQVSTAGILKEKLKEIPKEHLHEPILKNLYWKAQIKMCLGKFYLRNPFNLFK